jgi:CRP/FNR family transcriptional regulator
MNTERTCCIFDATLSTTHEEVDCSDCGLDPMCLVLDYAEQGSGVPEGILLRRQPVGLGEKLYNAHQDFDAIYAVKSGSFKAFIEQQDGTERVVGFYIAGDLMGAEAIAEHEYSCSVRALEPSQVCMLHIDRLVDSGRSLEAVQSALINMLGKEVALNHLLTAALVRQNAEQRLAAFLTSLSDRMKGRGFSPLNFELRMSRSDIGSYLGLARETVSRLLTQFQRRGLIQLRKRQLQLLDPHALRRLAYPL